MVIKPTGKYYSNEQPSNMQYPPSGPPPTGQDNWQSPPSGGNQYQGYPPQGPPPYGMSGPPSQSAPYGAPPGESSGYYGNAQQSSQPPPQARYENQYYTPPQPGYSNPYAPPPQHQAPIYGGPPNQSQYGYGPPDASPYGAPHNQSQYGNGTPDASPYGAPPPVPTTRPEGYGPASVKQEELKGQPGAGPQTDEERGLMGALAGGATGGYAGHKMHHGFLGALGGAYAGHKLEDAYKDHKKTSQSPQPPPIQHDSRPEHHNQSYSGNFSASSTDMSIDGDFDLIASCSAVDGHKKLTSISLNKVLTNDNGHFRWVEDGGNFGGSARNVRLVDGGRVLEAEMRQCDGHWNTDHVRLDERITNDNGNLRLG